MSLCDCVYREKDVGGGLCHGHISQLVHPKTLLLDRLELAKKRTEKSRKHLLRRASDSQFLFCRLTLAIFYLRWQIPLAVTSSTWQTSQLDKLTWQVDLSPCPFATLQLTWQVITCQVDLSSQLEQSSYHASVGLWLSWGFATQEKMKDVCMIVFGMWSSTHQPWTCLRHSSYRWANNQRVRICFVTRL